VTPTETVPSVGGWLVGPVNAISADWHADSLTYARVSLMVETPESRRWPVMASSFMTLIFYAGPFNRPQCAPVATEASPLGPAYPTFVYQEIFGTGRFPLFWGCGYVSITGSGPYTVRVLISDAPDRSATGPWTCQGGKAVAGIA
jgi:hypothetical protein